MRKIIYILLIIISNSTIACIESANRHTNPDGSEGGLVGEHAQVEETAFIAYDAKVCERAFVKGNARVLDFAVISGEAIIQGNSIIKDEASITESSLVRGSELDPTIVGGKSRVYGASKVLEGSTVLGEARIFGAAVVSDSIIQGQAIICESYIVDDRTVYDRYFCQPNAIPSNAEISVLNLKQDSFNINKRNIIFKATGAEFYSDEAVYQIRINSIFINPDYFQIIGNQLRVEKDNLFQEGENTVEFIGRDNTGKSIGVVQFEFIIGSHEHAFQISQVSTQLDSSFMFDVTYLYENKEYKAHTRYIDGKLVLKGIPDWEATVGLKIHGIGQFNYIVENFNDLNLLPNALSTGAVPKFINNRLNFLDGLDSWDISHPGNVTTEPALGGARVVITPHESDIVEFSKTFRLFKRERSLSVNFTTNAQLMNVVNNGGHFQVVFAAKCENQIEVHDFNLGNMQLFSKKMNEFLNVKVLKKSDKISDYLVVVRLFPSGNKLDYSLILEPLDVSKIFFEFNPQNFVALNNVTTAAMVPPTSPMNRMKCNDPRFNLNSVDFTPLTENMKFFSAGRTPLMDSIFKENRIFGELTLKGVDRSRIIQIDLVGEQDGVEKFVVPLSVCANEAFVKRTSGDGFTFFHGNNLVKFTFSIPNYDLYDISTIPGSSISIRAKALLLERGKEITIYTNPTFLPILSSPDLPIGFIYNNNSDIEDYDNPSENVLRTGGDKWIDPIYANKLSSLLRLFHYQNEEEEFIEWKVNDLSKLNGGHFLPRKPKTHIDGIDADVKFEKELISDNDCGGGDYVEFDFKKLGICEKKWEYALWKMQFFLKRIQPYFDIIRDINISISEVSTANRFLVNFFENRCIKGRFIHLTANKGSGSLLRDVPTHWHHLHIRFNDIDRAAKSPVKNNMESPEANLEDFLFSVDSNGKNLKVEPLYESRNKLKDKKIFWRFQDTDDYYDPNLIAEFAPSEFEQKNIPTNAVLKYLHLVVANSGNYGRNVGCTGFDIELDPKRINANTSSLKWKYVKNLSGKLEMKEVK